VSWITDTPDGFAYLAPVFELDGCGCLTSEEHLSRCVLWARAGIVRARPAARAKSETAREGERRRMARWRAANPERWRAIQRASDERRKARRAA
jgi:hypothetical protein